MLEQLPGLRALVGVVADAGRDEGSPFLGLNVLQPGGRCALQRGGEGRGKWGGMGECEKGLMLSACRQQGEAGGAHSAARPPNPPVLLNAECLIARGGVESRGGVEAEQSGAEGGGAQRSITHVTHVTSLTAVTFL